MNYLSNVVSIHPYFKVHPGQMGVFKVATLTRLEIHGPATELDQLRGPLAQMNPAWFVLEAGLRR